MIDKRLLEILACPKCKGELEYRQTLQESLVCHNCKLVYPVRENIPIMLIEKALPQDENE